MSLDKLCSEVQFRDTQFSLLHDLLMKSDDSFLYPNLHLFGLSGTGKTYAIKKFMRHFCDNDSSDQCAKPKVKYFIYLDCNELCYSNTQSLLFNEIISQVKTILNSQDRELGLGTNKVFMKQQNILDDNDDDGINFRIEEETSGGVTLGNPDHGDNDDINDDGGGDGGRIVDCSAFVRQLQKLLARFMNTKRVCFYLVFDNAENLKNYGTGGGDAVSQLLLSFFKINEYLNIPTTATSNNIVNTANTANTERQSLFCNLFVSECDWHSLLSDFDLMSRTEAPRPFVIHFGDYSKEQMSLILRRRARQLVHSQQEYHRACSDERLVNIITKLCDVEFYAKIILDVFYPICKDLNEIQYLIQIYYDQLVSSIATTTTTTKTETTESESENDAYKKMIAIWNKMKPFLKSALTQIYLRQSMFNNNNNHNKENVSNNVEQQLEKCFKGLNIIEGEKSGNMNESSSSSGGNNNNNNNNCSLQNELPKLMKVLLVSAYIATHNPPKYDKKLFDYHAVQRNARKSKHTSHKLQRNEEDQRTAALKTRSFDMNRLMPIFFAICADNGYHNHHNHSEERSSSSPPVSLEMINRNVKTLKSLHYLQQTNSGFSSLDEPKFKCLLDFDTVTEIAASINFNMKQYLAEYITI